MHIIMHIIIHVDIIKSYALCACEEGHDERVRAAVYVM